MASTRARTSAPRGRYAIPRLTGGTLGSHNFVRDFESRGDSLHVATDGAGVYRLDLRAALPAWSKFARRSRRIAPAESPYSIALGRASSPARAATESRSRTIRVKATGRRRSSTAASRPGSSTGLAVTPSGVVAAGSGHAFRSATGEASWTSIPPGLGAVTESPLVARGSQVFAAFNKLGQTYSAYLPSRTAPGTFPSRRRRTPMRARGPRRRALRGAHRRSVVAFGRDRLGAGEPVHAARVALALDGANPGRGGVRFRVIAPADAPATLRVFDVQGREVARPLDASFVGDGSVVTWNAEGARPGVYFARLEAAGEHSITRFVRLP